MGYATVTYGDEGVTYADATVGSEVSEWCCASDDVGCAPKRP